MPLSSPSASAASSAAQVAQRLQQGLGVVDEDLGRDRARGGPGRLVLHAGDRPVAAGEDDDVVARPPSW